MAGTQGHDPPNYFIFVANDGFTETGSKVDAYGIACWRIHHGRWAVYRATRNRNLIRPGDNVAVYVGGQRKHRQTVIATARVREIGPYRRDTPVDPVGVDNELPQSVVYLDEQKLITPRPIRPMLDHLSFIPENHMKWGVALMGGIRRISHEDFNRICFE